MSLVVFTYSYRDDKEIILSNSSMMIDKPILNTQLPIIDTYLTSVLSNQYKSDIKIVSSYQHYPDILICKVSTNLKPSCSSRDLIENTKSSLKNYLDGDIPRPIKLQIRFTLEDSENKVIDEFTDSLSLLIKHYPSSVTSFTEEVKSIVKSLTTLPDIPTNINLSDSTIDINFWYNMIFPMEIKAFMVLLIDALKLNLNGVYVK